MGCSFYCEDHVQFHIFIRSSKYHNIFHTVQIITILFTTVPYLTVIQFSIIVNISIIKYHLYLSFSHPLPSLSKKITIITSSLIHVILNHYKCICLETGHSKKLERYVHVYPGGVLGISSDGDDRMEPKVKTQKNP